MSIRLTKILTSMRASARAASLTLALVALPGILLPGCGAVLAPTPPVAETPADTEAETTQTADPDREWEPVQVVIYKSQRTLMLYKRGEFYRQYPILLGFKPEGPKRWQHDARTPEGYYHITEKRPHARWQHFLSIDYPNRHDRARYKEALAEGRVPILENGPLSIGGNIGIHGNDKPEEHLAGKDWTKGCIAMTTEGIEEVAELVEVGSPVWVLE